MYWSIPLHVHTSGNDVFWISFVLLNNDISQLFISVFKQVPPTRLFLVENTSIIYTAVAVQIRAWCIKYIYIYIKCWPFRDTHWWKYDFIQDLTIRSCKGLQNWKWFNIQQCQCLQINWWFNKIQCVVLHTYVVHQKNDQILHTSTGLIYWIDMKINLIQRMG